jgi:HEAT repeat protein
MLASGWIAATLIAAAPDAGDGEQVLSAEAHRTLERALDHRRDREERIRAIAKIGASKEDAAVSPLAFELARSDGEVRAALLRALSDLGAVRVLALDLAARDLSKRRRAVQLLALIADPTSVDALLSALQDRDAKVREGAASALSRLRAPRTIGALGEMLENDGAPDARSAAAQALGRLGGVRAIEATSS